MASTRRAAESAGSMMNRAVRVQINPETRNIRESREILRTMKEYGDVISFRNKKYDIEYPATNVITAIFSDKASAARFVAATPLSITISPPPPRGPVSSPASLGILDGLGTLTNTVHNEEYRAQQAPAGGADAEEKPREFLVKAEMSNTEQSRYFRRQPFYWGYEISHHPSYTRDDLAAHVPLQGMCDVERRPELPNDKVLGALEELRRIKTLRQMCQERDAASSSESDAVTP